MAPAHELWATPEFVDRMASLTAAASSDARARSILKEALKTVDDLENGVENGVENGHHPLGFTPATAPSLSSARIHRQSSITD